MNEEEEQAKSDRADEAIVLEDEIRELKSLPTRYRYALMYVSGTVTLAVTFEIVDLLGKC